MDPLVPLASLSSCSTANNLLEVGSDVRCSCVRTFCFLACELGKCGDHLGRVSGLGEGGGGELTQLRCHWLRQGQRHWLGLHRLLLLPSSRCLLRPAEISGTCFIFLVKAKLFCDAQMVYCVELLGCETEGDYFWHCRRDFVRAVCEYSCQGAS